MKLFVFTDGGSRWNPGPAWCGVYIKNIDTTIEERRYKYIWIATNNVAEYTAAYLWIQRAIELWATEIELRADSELLVRQLSGIYKIKNPELKKLATLIHEGINSWWGKIEFIHIYREENTEADRLSNVAMDKKES